MTVDELTKNASNLGFERGSLTAINLVLDWLGHHGHRVIAVELLADWDGGRMEATEPAPFVAATVERITHHPTMIDTPTPQPVSPTDLGPTAPKLVTRATASLMGFTGNCCSTCGSYQMVRNGTCEKCQDCGSTTGCS